MTPVLRKHTQISTCFPTEEKVFQTVPPPMTSVKRFPWLPCQVFSPEEYAAWNSWEPQIRAFARQNQEQVAAVTNSRQCLYIVFVTICHPEFLHLLNVERKLQGKNCQKWNCQTITHWTWNTAHGFLFMFVIHHGFLKHPTIGCFLKPSVVKTPMINHKFEITTKQKQQVSHQGAEKFQTKQGFSGWGNAAGNGENRSAPSCQTLSHNSENYRRIHADQQQTWKNGSNKNLRKPRASRQLQILHTKNHTDTFDWIRLNPITMSHRSEKQHIANFLASKIASLAIRSHRGRLVGWEMDKMDFSYSTPFLLALLLGSCIMNVCGFLWLAQTKYIQKNRNKNICSKTFEVSGPKPSHKKSSTNQEEPYQYTPTTWSWKLGQSGHEEHLEEVKMKKKNVQNGILLDNSIEQLIDVSNIFLFRSIEFLSIADFRVGYPPLLGGSKQRSLCSGRLGIIPKASIFRCMFYLSGDGRTFQSNLVQNHPIKKWDLIYCLWKFAAILFSRGISVVPSSCHVH